MLIGLFGYPVDHSFSPAWFREKFRLEGLDDAEYRLFPSPSAAGLLQIIRQNPGLIGLNVTIPHKTAIIPFLDELAPSAQAIGAVNVVRILRAGDSVRTRGYNTDAWGFEATLADLSTYHAALVLGTGGASLAVTHALSNAGIDFLKVSRNPAGPGILGYEQLSRSITDRYPLVINTTPLGMFPDTGTFAPYPYENLTGGHFTYDLVYNPPETEFLRRGRIAGAGTRNGLSMLRNQAEEAFSIFLGGQDI